MLGINTFEINTKFFLGQRMEAFVKDIQCSDLLIFPIFDMIEDGQGDTLHGVTQIRLTDRRIIHVDC